jgi:di/tripeptidase
MNKNRLKEVLSIPSVYEEEGLVRDYIKKYAEDNDIDYFIDKKGNIYLTKGDRENLTEGEFYPCVVAHMDTVHRKHIPLVYSNQRLDIVEQPYEDSQYTDLQQTALIAKHPTTKEQTGIGGDDKCGVAVCLEMLDHFDVIKAAFFVEEEIGMKGSQQADEKFFSNVGYAIQFDAPSSDWITEVCSGQRLFDKDFKDLITEDLSNNGYTNYSNDPFTDVNQLAKKFDFSCLNLGCGYYRQHTDSEYVIVEEVEDAIRAGKSLITKLGLEFYKHEKNKSVLSEERNALYYDVDDIWEDELKEMSNDITESVVSMLAMGYDKDEISEHIYEYLEKNYY